MASNGLVANPKKTAMILLKSKAGQDEAIKINIGNEIVKQHHSAKLIGMTISL